MQSAHLANKPDEMQEGYIEEDGTRRKKMEGPLDRRCRTVGDRQRIRHVGIHTCDCLPVHACMVVCSARMSVMLA